MSVQIWERLRNLRKLSNHRQRRQLLIAALIGAFALPLSGCSAYTGLRNTWSYNGTWNEGMFQSKIKHAAKRAWKSRSHCYANQQHLKDFARGFRAGYVDVADGGTGCTPTFPPREYWGWKYQSAEGQAKVSAWFSGFPYGAQAAEEDGMGNYSQIQTSLAIQKQYAEHGLLNAEYAGIYPIPEKAIPNGFNVNTPASTQAPVPTPDATTSVLTDNMPMHTEVIYESFGDIPDYSSVVPSY